MVFHEGEVSLAEVAVFHLDGHAGESLARFGEHDRAAHGSVDAVDEAGEDVAGLVVFFLDVFLHIIEQALVARFVALHDFGGQLVDDDEVSIPFNS